MSPPSAQSDPAGSDARRPLPALLRSTVFRVTLIYLCLFSASVLIVVAVIHWAATEALTRQIDATVDAEITALAEQFDQNGLPGLVSAIDRRSDQASSIGGLYLLTDTRRGPLAGNLSRWPDVEPDEEGWITFPLDYASEEGGGINFGRARVFRLGIWYYLLVGHDVRERLLVASLVREALIWGIAITIGLSLLGGTLMSRRLLDRIETINRTSRDIMAGDLTRRIPNSGGQDEFDQLAGNLNAMLDRIEHLLTSVKHAGDNIAHDLRSPLTRLRSRLEIALMGKLDVEASREVLRETIVEADRLLQTFNALLSISQIEAGAPSRDFTSFPAVALLTDVAELYEPLAEAKGQAFKLSIPSNTDPQLALRGGRDLLSQAVANLLENAIKFTPAEGQIELGLTRRDRDIVITVADSGPGIPEEARERVLERFTRLEISRSTPGAGLGLSLVAAVAALHGGKLLLADNLPGLRAELVLPASAQ